MDEITPLINKFEELRASIGWGAAIISVLILLSIVFLWKYLGKAVERSAEEASEKSIRKYQIQLDKELTEHNVKFSAKHQKQIDAIHEIYIRFQNLFAIMKYMQHGDKYSLELEPHREVKSLIAHRTDFIKIYGLHKIVIPREICAKIDELIPSIEEFIDTYKAGLFPEGAFLEETSDGNDEMPQLYIAGLWRHNAFDTILEKLEQVKNDVEIEFRKIYGT